MFEILQEFILQNLRNLGIILGAILLIEILFRLIPTKKPINLLALVGRYGAKLCMLLVKLGKLLPENRR